METESFDICMPVTSHASNADLQLRGHCYRLSMIFMAVRYFNDASFRFLILFLRINLAIMLSLGVEVFKLFLLEMIAEIITLKRIVFWNVGIVSSAYYCEDFLDFFHQLQRIFKHED